VAISLSSGKGIEVIIDSLVLSDEVGGGKIDICLEVLEENGVAAGDAGCRNLWDAFSVGADDFNAGCRQLPEISQIVCTASGADLTEAADLDECSLVYLCPACRL
jgi:hypothetical protein